MSKKISCIIPAYNEEKSIAKVLSVAGSLLGSHIYEIIVIDDKSKDNTKKIVKTFSQVKLIENPINQGKSKSVANAIKQSQGDYIFLLDADLLFLNQENIKNLIEPIMSGVADVTISYRKNAWPLFPFKDIDYCSGERVFPKKYVTPFLDAMSRLPSYGLEVFINRNIIILNKLRLLVVKWPNVENDFHHKKKSLFAGIYATLRIWFQVIKSSSIIEIYTQNIMMKGLMVKENRYKISLVICAHNEENYIAQCLEYVLKNSHGKFNEIIVVNNASTDKTKEIAEKYPVRVLDEPNKGQVRARQRSVGEAGGDLIAYIDADTRMPENWVDSAIFEFEKDKDLALLSGPYIYYEFSSWENFLTKIYWYVFAYPTYLFVGYMAVGGNFVIRKDVLDKMNGFDTSIEFWGEDTNIAKRASQFGKVKFSLRFYMLSSARRLRQSGILKTAGNYVVNFLSQVFLKKSAMSSYEDIR